MNPTGIKLGSPSSHSKPLSIRKIKKKHVCIGKTINGTMGSQATWNSRVWFKEYRKYYLPSIGS